MRGSGSFVKQSIGYGAAWFVFMNANVIAAKRRNPNQMGWVNGSSTFAPKSLAVSTSYCLAIGSVVALQTTVLRLPAWAAVLGGAAVTLGSMRAIGALLRRPCPLPPPVK